MVPQSITLRNFLSYGENEVTLDLANMHVICLSGENGHGKSALLDAITWVLWGETRLGKQGHEQLIRIGADEMSVSLTFRVGKALYRAKRLRSRRTGGANWEIQRSDESGAWRALTGTNAAETARTIQQIVRMSYDTFLNSAYLKQGRADEFVRHTSNKRKEILCEILELSRYDQLEDKAKVMAKEAAENVADLDRQANQARAIAADITRFRAELAEVESHLTSRENHLSLIVEKRRAAEGQRAELFNLRNLKTSLLDQLNSNTQKLSVSRQEFNSSNIKLIALKELLKDRNQIQSDYEVLKAARHRQFEITDSINDLSKLRLEIFTLQTKIDNEKSLLQQRAFSLQSNIETANLNRKRSAELSQAIDALIVDKDKLGDIDVVSSELTTLKEAYAIEFADLKSENERLLRDLGSEELRQERLQAQTEKCSICGNPLPPGRIAELMANSVRDRHQILQIQSQVKAKAATIKVKVSEAAQKLAELDGVKRQAILLDQERIKLDQQRIQADLIAAPFDQLTEDLAAIIASLDGNQYSKSERVELVSCQQRLDRLAPLEIEHSTLTQTIRSLKGVEEIYQNLLSAEQQLISEQRIHDLSCSQVDLLVQLEADLLAQIGTLANVESEVRLVENEISRLAATTLELSSEISDIQKQIGRLQNSIDQCLAADRHSASIEVQRDGQILEESYYRVLTGAFGKRGIQANIIEAALPELQQYTNDILERLTDGDLRVFIETTRLSKSKNAAPVETLEIQISDSLGTRPLEMYSGGEAFRVSFALRIALSMLLVRRAGAELQTLIIDEGFGTQDAKGREKLVDAINAIKQDFDQILVITHIEELKEAFADRIEVYKSSEGSQLRVVRGDAIG